MTQPLKEQTVQIVWDWGTAYDLFASLVVLLDPEKYGLRGQWAAGVRSRIPPAERKFLEETFHFLFIPMHWISRLPEPKDSAAVLWALRTIPPQERLASIILSLVDDEPGLEKIFRDVAQRGSWNEADLAGVLNCSLEEKEKQKPEMIKKLLDWFSRSEEFGEQLLQALQAYHAVFFAEEEKRITPALQAALAHAQELSAELPLPDLLAELSQGVHFTALSNIKQVTLVPAYWTTPLIVYDYVTPEHLFALFGARPADSALVPGEVIPEMLLRALKAMGDPTRLRILRYLSHEALTPSQLSRRLRLRAPTVIHHLSALRMAGLVHLTLETETEKRYEIRAEGVDVTCKALKKFLEAGDEPESPASPPDR
jgi:DNA-binding transcriptional ArsR family regulator